VAGVEALARAGLPPELTHLDLSGNHLHGWPASSSSAGVEGGKSSGGGTTSRLLPLGLLHLDLRENRLGPDGIRGLGEAWAGGASLVRGVDTTNGGSRKDPGNAAET